MAYQIAKLSSSLRAVTFLLRLQFGGELDWTENQVPHAVPAMETLREVTRQLHLGASGKAFFVHVLLPHYPYVVNSDCRLRSPASWLNRRTIVSLPTGEKQAAYFEQISCVLKVVQPLFDAAGPTAVLIVHGDHGSRITEVDPRADMVGRFDAADMIAGFSTLFAVRAPELAAGYDRRPLPIGVLLQQFVGSAFRDVDVQLPPAFSPSVVLEQNDWKPSERYPLPLDWPTPD